MMTSSRVLRVDRALASVMLALGCNFRAVATLPILLFLQGTSSTYKHISVIYEVAPLFP